MPPTRRRLGPVIPVPAWALHLLTDEPFHVVVDASASPDLPTLALELVEP